MKHAGGGVSVKEQELQPVLGLFIVFRYQDTASQYEEYAASIGPIAARTKTQVPSLH